MEEVANYLVKQAKQRKIAVEKDQFARSSFNRYYYATFLIVRQTLTAIDENWRETPHKRIPEILRTSYVKRIRRQLDKNVLGKSDSKKLASIGAAAASELARLMEIAYEKRVTADYAPETLVVFDATTISLEGLSTSEACNWIRRARFLCSKIHNVAKQSGLG